MPITYEETNAAIKGLTRGIAITSISSVPVAGVVLGPLMGMLLPPSPTLDLESPPLTRYDVTNIATDVWDRLYRIAETEKLRERINHLKDYYVIYKIYKDTRAEWETHMVSFQDILHNDKTKFMVENIKGDLTDLLLAFTAFANLHISVLSWGATQSTSNDDETAGLTKRKAAKFQEWLRGTNPLTGGKDLKPRQKYYEAHMLKLSDMIIAREVNALPDIGLTGQSARYYPYEYKDNPYKNATEASKAKNEDIETLTREIKSQHEICFNHIREVRASTLCYVAYEKTTASSDPKKPPRLSAGNSSSSRALNFGLSTTLKENS